MKHIITLIFFLFTAGIVFSQNLNADSILKKIDAANGDTSVLNKIFNSTGNLSEVDPILDMKITQKLLMQYEKLSDKKNIAFALANIAYDYRAFGNTTKAMEYAFKSLEVAEEIGIDTIITPAKFTLGHIYKDQGDYQKTIELYKSVEKIWITHNNNIGLSLVYMNMGQVYLFSNKIDSALMYEQQAYELSTRFNFKDYLCSILRVLGSIHGKMNNQSLALSYFDLSIQEAKRINSPRFESESYTALAEYYNDIKQKDSSLYYAKKAIDVIKNTAFSTKSIKPAKLLLEIYLKSNSDSALKYSEIYRIANDSLFSAKIIQQTQLMSYENELRLQQMASEKKQQEEQRKQNLQFALIALGIVSFIIIYLLLSRSFITNTRLVEFFGIIALLIVFEFLNLLLHPFLERITNHSPVLMLILLVGVAALLVPLHHRVEKWATKILVEKNKKIRLAAAKKTIEKLEGNNN